MDSDLTPEFEAFRAVAEARRSARSFLPEPIPESVLTACFDIAIRAPSAMAQWRNGAMAQRYLWERLVVLACRALVYGDDRGRPR